MPSFDLTLFIFVSFKVGDFICYKHERTKIGVIIEVNFYDREAEEHYPVKYPIRFEQEQCYLVMWQTPNAEGMRKWYVAGSGS